MTDDTPPLNREQRRAQKFRSRRTGRQDNLQTQRENDTGFLSSPTETLADAPTDVVDATAAVTATAMVAAATAATSDAADGAAESEDVPEVEPR